MFVCFESGSYHVFLAGLEFMILTICHIFGGVVCVTRIYVILVVAIGGGGVCVFQSFAPGGSLVISKDNVSWSTKTLVI